MFVSNFDVEFLTNFVPSYQSTSEINIYIYIYMNNDVLDLDAWLVMLQMSTHRETEGGKQT